MDFQSDLSKKKVKDLCLTVLLAHSVTSFFDKKSNPEDVESKNTQAPLKHFEMWANYDKMITKLDDDAIVDLNIELMQVIGTAVKNYRKKQSDA